MQWSKLKKRYEQLLADSLILHLQVHVTAHRKSPFDEGRGWIVFEGREVVSIRIPSFYDDEFRFSTDTLDLGKAVGKCVESSIEELKATDDPILKGLMFLDRRAGRRFLQEVDDTTLHPFSRILYRLRCDAEGIQRPTT